MPLARFGRAALAAVVPTLLLAGAPAAASPSVGYVWLKSAIGSQAVVAGSGGKTARFWYEAVPVDGAPMPGKITAKIDASAATAVTVTLARPTPGCTVRAAVITCSRTPEKVRTLAPQLFLRLTPAPGARPGDRAAITVTVTAAGAEPDVSTSEIAVTGSAPDLQMEVSQLTAKPGATVTHRPAIRNAGDQPARTIVLKPYIAADAAFATRYRNCHYKRWEWGAEAAYCVLQNVNLQPGETIRQSAATPQRIAISPNVPGRSRTNRHYEPAPYTITAIYYPTAVDAPPADAEELTWPAGTGPELTFDRISARAALDVPDADPSDDNGRVHINVLPANPSDMVAEGGTIRGVVGDVVPLRLTLTNRGPAAVSATPEEWDGDPKDPYNPALRFTPPPGVEVVEVRPPGGWANQTWHEERDASGRTSYVVVPYVLNHQARYSVEFLVRITNAAPSRGTVGAQGGVSDPNLRNNTAVVSLNPRL